MPRTRPLTALLLLLTACVLLPGCGGDDHEAVTKDMLGVMTEFNQVMETVTDTKSAEAAVPKLTKIGKQMEAIQKRMDSLEDEPAETGDAIRAKYQQQIDTQATAMVGHIMRLESNPEIKAVLDEAMKDLDL